MRFTKENHGDIRVLNCERRVQVRGFLTPPPTWTPPHSRANHRLFSERKMDAAKSATAAGTCKTDLFHVIHKVPAGDSPYVKAKHLIEKDPNRAVSMFWAAINAGDRVDSALKDMAVVLKQLNRSDEAIEAIKSFRHLCVQESQESIDNVLVELFKRSGRVEEEIEMLQRKLKNIEEGMVFGGRKTKVARSQGKKIQITVEQEKARILGNLAWAYLQQHNYGLAEQHYRKALSLEADKNKQCNLAVCLMHMNKLTEARALLQAVRASCGNKPMDESYSKSFDRAYQMLIDLERGVATSQPSTEPSSSSSSPRQSQGEVGVDHGWRECPYLAVSPFGSIGGYVGGNYTGPRRQHRPSCADKTNCYASSPTPVLFSQPRRCLFMNGDNKIVTGFQGMQNLNHTPKLRSQPRWTSSSSSLSDGDWRKPWRQAAVSPGNTDNNTIVVKFPVEVDNKGSEAAAAATSVDKEIITNNNNKSWADMVEEEEEEELEKQLLGLMMWDDDREKGSVDENQDANVADEKRSNNAPQHWCLLQTPTAATTTTTATAVRRLCFDGKKTTTMIRNRLQVFKDITPTIADTQHAI
ncbi:Protein POLLENLESS 3 [Linum perenne]